MKFETVSDAFIAATILLLTSIIEKFASGQIQSVTEISEASWWVMGGGALISFLKAYQTLSSRRLFAKLRGRNYEPNHPD